MPEYKYKAVNKDGRLISGIVDAPTENLATEMLKEKELDIKVLSEKGSGIGGFNINIERIKPKDIVIFSRQFSVLISANVALVQSLRLLIEQTDNSKLKATIAEVAEEIDGGARLSDTLGKRPKVFSNFYVNVIRSGETSGKLDEVLTYLADELEKDYDMTSKIKGAMIYPAFVLSGLAVVGAVMMIFVVPKLTDILSESGTELPLATKVLMGTSAFLSSYWWLVVILLVLSVVGIKVLLQVPVTRKIVDYLLLHLPIFGKLFRQIYLVRFTRSLETLLLGGVNISHGLEITADIVTNSVYRQIILATKKEVEDGNSMANVFIASKEVPSMVGQMIGIGERTGKLDTMLASISHFYGREIDNSVSNLMTLMEPIIMVIIGIAVGMMVAAIIMPMYNMTSAY